MRLERQRIADAWTSHGLRNATKPATLEEKLEHYTAPNKNKPRGKKGKKPNQRRRKRKKDSSKEKKQRRRRRDDKEPDAVEEGGESRQ